MKIIKNFWIKLFWINCRLILPKKYFDVIFITEFLKSKELKKLNFVQIVWCFTHGFLPGEYLWYDLAKNDYRNYVPALKDYQKRFLNRNFNSVMGNKILFEQHIKTAINGIEKIRVVESIGYIDKGYLFPLKKNIILGEYTSLIPYLKKSDLILKPIFGNKGKGVLLLKKVDDYYEINNKKVSWDELLSIFKNFHNYLIQEKLMQIGFSNEINPASVNTVRIATMIDPDTQQSFIAYATHRFGSLHSGFVDNGSQGGIAANVDTKTGTLGEALWITPKGDKETFKLHPMSLKPIHNEHIPNWENLSNCVIEMANRMPYFKYVGWDIIFSNDEVFVLEGNTPPGLPLAQLFKPMNEYIEAWKFFKYYNYV